MTPATQASPPEATAVDILDRIVDLAQTSPNQASYLKAGARAVAEHYEAPYGLVRFQLPTGELEDVLGTTDRDMSAWAPICESVLLDAQASSTTSERVYEDEQAGSLVAVVAVPLRIRGLGTLGGLALLLAAPDRPGLDAKLLELRSLALVLEQCQTGLTPDAPVPSQGGSPAASTPAPDSAAAVGKASGYGSLEEFAFAITNNLRPKARADQVSLGWIRSRRAKLLSISGIDDPKPRLSGTASLRQAMEECFDRGESIVYQQEDRWEEGSLSTQHRLHAQWSDENGRCVVASIPLAHRGKVVAVLSLRRSAGLPIDEEEMAKLTKMIAPFGSALELLRRANRGFTAHVANSLGESLRSWASKAGLGTKLAWTALIAFMAWFCLGTIDKSITVPATLVPSQVVHVAAPFSGTLAESYCEAGDRVLEGDLLARFDTRDLELQRNELISEHESLRVERDQAVGSRDLLTASQSRAKLAVVEARLASLDRRLAGAEIRAPRDGVVLMGDLGLRIGQTMPQGEPLFELAPPDRVRLEIQLPEDLSDEVHEGLALRFASNARPEDPLDGKLERIRPSSEIVDMKSVFVVESELHGLGNHPWLRVGMEGVAKVQVGRDRVWRVALAGVLDYVHRELWL